MGLDPFALKLDEIILADERSFCDSFDNLVRPTLQYVSSSQSNLSKSRKKSKRKSFNTRKLRFR
jgi:hypothetical protein